MDTNIAESVPVNRHPWLPHRLLDVHDYHRMGEAGIFAPDERVELIEGELIAMAPIGSEHAGAVNALNRMLVLGVGSRAVVSVQNPVRLGKYSEPQPDFALLRPRADEYRRSHATPDDVLLLIEVADTSLAYDRKLKRALYARHGIAEFWLLNLADGEIEICRGPVGDSYTEISVVGREAELEPMALRGMILSAAAVLGD